MIEAVLDTNVLASGLIGLLRPSNTPGEILRRWFARSFILILSDPILIELERTLQKPYFARRFEEQERVEALTIFRRRGRLVPITASVVAVAAHPEDDLVLPTAISAGAGYVVTGDKRLRSVGSHRHVTILTPREFLNVLDRR